MTFEFQLTEDDFKQAVAANARRESSLLRKKPQSPMLLVVYSFALLAYILISVELPMLNRGSPPGDANHFLRPIARVFTPLLPILLLGMLPRYAKSGWGWLVIVVFDLMAVVLISGPQLLRLPRNASPLQVYLALDPSIPWVIVLSFVGISVLLRLRGTVADLYRRQQNLHGRKTITVYPDSLLIDEPLTTIRYRWPRFKQVVETKDVLLLYVSDVAFFIIPRRQLPPDVYSQFREMIRENVENRLQAFPVIPTQQVTT